MVSRSLGRANQPRQPLHTVVVVLRPTNPSIAFVSFQTHQMRRLVERVVQCWSNRDPVVTVANRGVVGGDMNAHKNAVSGHIGAHTIRVPNLRMRCPPTCWASLRASFSRNTAQKNSGSRPGTEQYQCVRACIHRECDTCFHYFCILLA